MQELNVQQSGIERRVHTISHFKNRFNKIFKKCDERYLRSDVPCGWKSCPECAPFVATHKSGLLSVADNSDATTSVPFVHAAIFETEALNRALDVLGSSKFSNVVICQSVWDAVRKNSLAAYKKMNALCYDANGPRHFVFLNELHHRVFEPKKASEAEFDHQVRTLLSVGRFLAEHWTKFDCRPVLIVADDNAKKPYADWPFGNVRTIREYVSGMPGDNKELLNKLAAYEPTENSNRPLFDEYWSYEQLRRALDLGRVKKGVFSVSRENYREATVRVDDAGTEWFICGSATNRAVHGDQVAVELLPKEQWTAPERVLRLRDAEEVIMQGAEEADEDEEEGPDGEPTKPKKAKKTADRASSVEEEPTVVPTARVVGILRRNWRPYCGILLPPILKGSRNYVFCPTERLIPRVRVELEQGEKLLGKRVVVVIDSWPRTSRHPHGHYVRALGNLGDRETENEVLLLEHDVPHAPFSDAVLACLPKSAEDWKPNYEDPKRVDLRDRLICSVDPVGCTDIDDALHCKELPDGRLEVGVHIADVSHFVRPGTAMDAEAAMRGTTVYLCDRRIDMLPEMLSSNLCSLRGEEERYAFSVIWEMTSNGEILSEKFHKSLIKSHAALTYEKAQQIIDDKSDNSELAQSLRRLNAISKKMKATRMSNGALTLASSEVRFEMDWDTKTPKGLQTKQALDTHSLVEEFMLLANITVANRILNAYSDCALLRRHPRPEEPSYKPLIEAARKRGFELRVKSGRELADSLNAAVDTAQPMLNRLLRMITTRCMTQAVYFAAGTVPLEQYAHFGLAAPTYTHFTSPIRRYADLVVHRMLAAAIEADTIPAGLLEQAKIRDCTQNLNYRHRQAQYAGRASVQLNAIVFFRGKQEQADGFVMAVRKNGLQVFVPKYGLEAIIVIGKSSGVTIELEKGRLTAPDGKQINELDQVLVRVSVDERNEQRPRIKMELLEPNVPGVSVDYEQEGY